MWKTKIYINVHSLCIYLNIIELNFLLKKIKIYKHTTEKSVYVYIRVYYMWLLNIQITGSINLHLHNQHINLLVEKQNIKIFNLKDLIWYEKII